MQIVKIPKQLDPARSALQKSDYNGVVLHKDMPRLTSAVAEANDKVAVQMKFDTDAQGLNFFEGRLSSKVELICERCNESYTHPIDVSFSFTPVQGNEQADFDEIPDAYEPVEVNDQGEINILELIEDELILTLPIVALHAEKDCKVGSDDMTFGKIHPEADERPNPFAVLKELKRD